MFNDLLLDPGSYDAISVPRSGHVTAIFRNQNNVAAECPQRQRSGERSMVSRLSALLSAGLLIVVSNAAVAESGIASVYPHSYKGRRTASGQPLDPGAMTCAHRRHAFGTTLRVMIGEKSITCRVTDRGPFLRGRVIDITPVAARALGFSGLARVSVERM